MMPIKFKLFGNRPKANYPKTIEEFIKEVKNKGYDEVKVDIATNEGFIFYSCIGVFRSNDVELQLPLHSCLRFDHESINREDKKALEDIIKGIESLEEGGLRYNVEGGYSLQQLKEVLVHHGELFEHTYGKKP